MSLFRRRREQASPRQPHPDARVEAELQRILSLRAVIARKEALLASDHVQVTDLRRKVFLHPNWDDAPAWRTMIAALQEEAEQVEAEVAKLHDEIATRIGKIDDSDLAWLDNH